MYIISKLKKFFKKFKVSKPFQYKDLQAKIKANDVLFFHSITNNIGDLVCCPYDYFPEFAEAGVKINNHELFKAITGLGKTYVLELLKNKKVVFGGGGLIALERHQKHTQILELLALHSSSGGKVVIWGAGHNRIEGFEEWFDSVQPDFYPDFFERFNVGVRDSGTKYQWVPCVSCMHSYFDSVPEATDEVVAFLHGRESKEAGSEFEGVPIKYNIDLAYASDPMDEFEDILRFLARGKIVFTNSYHGMYWATLLGRKVVALPNSSKFLSFRYKPRFCCEFSDWRNCVLQTQRYPQALKECREATLSFYKNVVSDNS